MSASSSLITGIIVLAIVIYMIVRQFQERQVTFSGIIIIPAVWAYLTGVNIVVELTKHAIDPTLLIGALIIGLLPGLVLGFYRGNMALLRLDTTADKVYARTTTLSLIIWCILLVVRIGAAVLAYAPVGQTLLPLVLLITVLHALFLGNIIGEKYRLYQRSLHYRQGIQQPMPVPKIKW